MTQILNINMKITHMKHTKQQLIKRVNRIIIIIKKVNLTIKNVKVKKILLRPLLRVVLIQNLINAVNI